MDVAKPHRRRFLKRSAALGAALAASAGNALAARAQTVVPGGGKPADAPAPDDPTKELGEPVRPSGERSRFERAVREQFKTKTNESSWTFTPLYDSHGIVTPSALHFERHHGGVPDIDPRKHKLMIHGMVERPLVLTTDELRRLPSVSRIHFIECSGNTLTEWRAPPAQGGGGPHRPPSGRGGAGAGAPLRPPGGGGPQGGGARA